MKEMTLMVEEVAPAGVKRGSNGGDPLHAAAPRC